MSGVSGGGGAAWADVFKEAEAEIFKLMERDTCARPPVEPTTRRMCHTRPAATPLTPVSYTHLTLPTILLV